MLTTVGVRPSRWIDLGQNESASKNNSDGTHRLDWVPFTTTLNHHWRFCYRLTIPQVTGWIMARSTAWLEWRETPKLIEVSTQTWLWRKCEPRVTSRMKSTGSLSDCLQGHGKLSSLDVLTTFNRTGKTVLEPSTARGNFCTVSDSFPLCRVTLGNQLEGTHLVDEELMKRFYAQYPDGNCKAKSS